MIESIRAAFFDRREGRIAIFSILIYLVAGAVAEKLPAVLPLSSFKIWFCYFMPIPILLIYAQIGGFKRDYDSSFFNTCCMSVVVAMPFLATAYALLLRK